MLRRALIAGAVLWPLVLGGALAHRVAAGQSGATLWTTAVYLAASRVCHQHPERSFHTHDVKWPVCARCAGLYLGAPIGLLLAGLVSRWSRRRLWIVLGVVAAPTAATVLWEWFGGPMPPHPVRFSTALPLGTMIAATLVAMTHRVD